MSIFDYDEPDPQPTQAEINGHIDRELRCAIIRQWMPLGLFVLVVMLVCAEITFFGYA